LVDFIKLNHKLFQSETKKNSSHPIFKKILY